MTVPSIASSLSEAQRVADQLTPAQRDFILRMEAHTEDQVITKHDFAVIDPCVDFSEGWPATLWWGGMRINFGAGGDGIPRFRFNELGLAVLRSLTGQDHG